MNLGPIDNDRVASLVLTYTDPQDMWLRRLIGVHGLQKTARMIAGEEPATEMAEGYPPFKMWQDYVSRINLGDVVCLMGSLNVRFIIPADDEWPEQLDALHATPFGLFLTGTRQLPEVEDMIAIVGSRNASDYGAMLTGQWAAELANIGRTIVSGGAYGIDAAAHRGALAAPLPDNGETLPTIAVLAGGLDSYYPAAHRPLLAEVARRGIVISEVPPGARPTRTRFLARNRIIAALSASTIVTESRIRSGSLNTAGHAYALGRHVGAAPGSVYSAQSMGTHDLIRRGEAKIVTSTEAILALEYRRH